MKKLEFHKFCLVLPQATQEEIDALGADIKDKGLLEPITMFEGKILDGRNRYLGAAVAGAVLAEGDFETYEGPDPLGFVISRNTKRRHLTPAQAAMCAAEFDALLAGRPSDKKKVPAGTFSTESVANKMEVSKRSIQRARKVKAKGSKKVVAAVKAGKLKLKAAERIVKLPKAQQDKLAKQGGRALQRKAAQMGHKPRGGLAEIAKEAERPSAPMPRTENGAGESHPILDAFDAAWEERKRNWESHPAACPRVVYQGLRDVLEISLQQIPV